jgi:hypothetical protein
VNATPDLLSAVSDNDATVRAAAIQALGQTVVADGLPDLVQVLLQAKGDDEVRLAEEAVTATCSRIDDKQACANVLTAGLAKAGASPTCALLRLLRTVPVASGLDAVRGAAKSAEATVAETAASVLCEWPASAAAPDLLATAKTTDNAGRRAAALRGFLRLVGSNDLSPEQQMAMCREAAALVKGDDETNQLLGALATVPALDALNMAMEHLDNAALTNRVSWAAVTIGERIMGQHPGEVAAALDRALGKMNDANLLRRVRAARDQAAKASGR